MTSFSENILSNQTHPGDSSPTIVTGEKFKGDGYYGRSDGFHSVQYNLAGFIGTIEIQATLAVSPESTDWFTLSSSTQHISNGADNFTNGAFIYSFTGNYVWVRAYASNWTDGTISSIFLNH